MIVSKNTITDNVQVTLDGIEVEVLGRALWDEQLLYWGLLFEKKYLSDGQRAKWIFELRRLCNMSAELGRGSGTIKNTVSDLLDNWEKEN